MGDWVRDHLLATFILMVFVYVGITFLLSELYWKRYADDQDIMIYNKSKNYTDSTYLSGQDSMIYYVKKIHYILDNGTGNSKHKKGN